MKILLEEIVKRKHVHKAQTIEKHKLSHDSEIGYGLAISLIISGLVCVLFADHLHKLLPFGVAVVVICLGIFDIIHGFRTGEYKQQETKLTSNGIMFLILGIVIFCYKAESYTIIGAIWGTIGLIKGTEELNKTICYIANKEPFVKELLNAAVEITLGILLLLEPDGNLHHHIVLLGLESMVTGWEYIRKIFREDKEEEQKEALQK